MQLAGMEMWRQKFYLLTYRVIVITNYCSDCVSSGGLGMRKMLLLVSILTMAAVGFAFAGGIQSLQPEDLPEAEKCAACHNVNQNYAELSRGAHKGLKCLDCHLPGTVQRAKYDSKNCSFSRLGYHDKDGNWIECVDGNLACLRCHKEMGINNSKKKCWSCHMQVRGTDRIVIVKDKKEPLVPENVRETKKRPHLNHAFSYHAR